MKKEKRNFLIMISILIIIVGVFFINLDTKQQKQNRTKEENKVFSSMEYENKKNSENIPEIKGDKTITSYNKTVTSYTEIFNKYDKQRVELDEDIIEINNIIFEIINKDNISGVKIIALKIKNLSGNDYKVEFDNQKYYPINEETGRNNYEIINTNSLVKKNEEKVILIQQNEESQSNNVFLTTPSKKDGYILINFLN